MFLKISENTCVRVSGLQLYFKNTPTQVLSYEYCKILYSLFHTCKTFENSRNFTENGLYFTDFSATTQSLKITEKEKFTEYLSILKRSKDLLCFDIFASYGCSKNITSLFSDSSLPCFKRLILIY